MKHLPIIALDFPVAQEALAFLEPFEGTPLFVKVGMELFYQEGPAILDELKEKNCRIFLDLKLHDIPTTVQKAMNRLAALGVDLVNVHAAGGKHMMQAALEGLESGTPAGQKRPGIIAVTQLTSTSEDMMRSELLIDRPLQETVIRYGQLAYESGLDGVVCSVHESKALHEHISPAFLTVTPGIRLQNDQTDDQKRVATPAYAKEQGVSQIVVGRSITKAEKPLEAYHQILKEWE
ncbi:MULTISPECIES: orotidine-5'-phosphate decarboxylase [Bacillus]|jgi:orotidine-5'-phosphate decarboxylase|uniref:orotidine-5'-phosphate decarboxylase n=1 Tax=Bacillus TaxID=1386 RepID=UPI00082012F8|nr:MULTISPECIES: orotidine-5'-phosphate decarboxylase [Bacillus]AOC56848.1 orotidine 5'-phosphate decarboxylase [Bacillus pumilus]MBR0586227.1 orotidine-5'-phosphate decarboxylase [Bacillus pumilus DW2J2]MBR0615636.1 orotidine-5'-phosphate decarboxylase [Bacillus pumilus]MBR0621638.1 orotidine-5'-phosphate decarboxylase [Bacillus pumilus]MBR0623316.1 orotidine-5'-phosphate decarboxylase [Bacillus pumilus]